MTRCPAVLEVRGRWLRCQELLGRGAMRHTLHLWSKPLANGGTMSVTWR